jgi:hypothetical protein
MNFYHDLITQKSWGLLQRLRKQYQFILIGGWAVYLYTQALKSKDIDLVLAYEELEKIKNDFSLSKNERLKKYEARAQEAEIDIYVPYYSKLGLPVEDLEKFSISLQGFKTVKEEVLALLKQQAFQERKRSLKGRKDLIDLVSLFRLDSFDWQKYQQLASKYHLEQSLASTKELLQQTSSLKELNLNVHQTAKLKKKILSSMSSL